MNGLTETDIKELILSYDGVELDERSTDEVSIYSIDSEIMATVKNNSKPLSINLRCDYNLGKLLQDKYESVSSGQNLSKNRFINILLVGQLADDDVRDQIRHAYEETMK